MKVERGIANVTFGFLPDQTADLQGSTWRVDRWREPKRHNVDDELIRGEILRAIHPWIVTGKDRDLREALQTGVPIEVFSPSPDGGVSVESFPGNFRCKDCGEISRRPDRPCQGCRNTAWVQLPFVAFHECGYCETPWIPTCGEHKRVRMDQTSSSSIRDLSFKCPVCSKSTVRGTGLPVLKCSCGSGRVRYNVHRATAVYTPRSTVVVNPPARDQVSSLRAPGNAERVLDWALRGMPTGEPLEGSPSPSALLKQLTESGVDDETAAKMVEVAAGDLDASTSPAVDLRSLDAVSVQAGTEAALELAYATAGGRIRVDDLLESARPGMVARYTHSYPEATRAAGLTSVDYVPEFPVLDAVYGYTRDQPLPGDSDLRWFGSPSEGLEIHGMLNETEALLFRLEPRLVAAYLTSLGFLKEVPDDPTDCRLAIIEGTELPRPGEVLDQQTKGSALLELVHSFSHRFLRRASAFCGIDREALSEYLVPLHLSFIIYASSRGDFVLGGLQSLFEHDLDSALEATVNGERRCSLDPGCTGNGGACVACLHIGEPSCRYFNQHLRRESLFGSSGFLALVDG